jgi:hypothetical protein
MEGLNMKHLFVAEDGTETILDYTKEEIALAEKNKKAEAIELAQQLIKAQAKAVAEGKLAALGLTTDDLRALGL